MALSNEEIERGIERLANAIDWSSPLVNVSLIVELPFWLLMPTSEYEITDDDCTVRARVANDYWSVQQGTEFRQSQLTTIFVGRSENAKHRATSVNALVEGGIVRRMRSVVDLDASVHSDVLNGIWQPAPRYSSAFNYLRTLAIANLLFLNKLIASYKRVSNDPFAHTVSLFDVPVWFVWDGKDYVRISLSPYFDLDEPFKINSRGNSEPVWLANPSQVKDALTSNEPPGVVHAHEAWTHYYHGRFEDAVRTIVTAIEVALESKLREALIRKDAATAEARLKSTWNSFEARLKDFCQVEGRSVPGPLLHGVPYINGIRLHQEALDTRTVRHKIVHEGHQIDYRDRGPMLKMMETMTWLFDWVMNEPQLEIRDTKNAVMFSVLSGHAYNMYPFTYGPKGIRIHAEPTPTEEDVKQRLDTNLFAKQLSESLDNQSIDLPLFAAMALKTYLGFEGILPAGATTDSSLPHPDLIALADGIEIPVYLIDVGGVLDVETICKVIAHAVSRWRSGNRFRHVVCLVNHQRSVPWQHRVGKAAGSEASTVAGNCGVSIIATSDLARLALSARTNGWDLPTIRDSLLRPGIAGESPSHYRKVGQVTHVYDRHLSASVQLDSDASVNSSDRVAVRLRDRFVEVDSPSLHLNGQPTAIATGELVGIGLGLRRNELHIGAEVFTVRTSEPDSPTPSAAPEPAQMGTEVAYCDACLQATPHSVVGSEVDLERVRFRQIKCATCGMMRRVWDGVEDKSIALAFPPPQPFPGAREP